MIRSILAGWLLWLAVAGETSGGTGDFIELPPVGSKNPSGLILRINCRWVDGSGYRPVWIEVATSNGLASPADRHVRVLIKPRGWNYGHQNVEVATDLTLPQGQVRNATMVPFPCSESWSAIRIRTLEDDREWGDLSHAAMGWPVRSYYQWTDAAPSIIVIHPAAPPLRDGMPSGAPALKTGTSVLPDLRALAGQIPMNHRSGLPETAFETTNATDDLNTLRLLQDLPRIALVPPESVPRDWISWTSVDMVLVARDALEQLVSQHPDGWQALRRWLSAGGTLSVYDLPAGDEELVALERLVDLPPLESPPGQSWRRPDPRVYGQVPMGLRDDRQNGVRPVTPENDPPNINPPEGPPPFVMRPAEQGWLVAITADPPFPGDLRRWNWLFATLGPEAWMWYRRTGISLRRENSEFWAFLIPGVGRAPVTAFVLIISVFVIAIGPVNYLLLRRRRKLFLLLVTVPAGALLITAAMVVYALVSEGLHVRTRIRSITELDQRNGRVVSWSRQSYYAGLAPTGGLRYPRDAAVFPVEANPAWRWRGGSVRHLAWDEHQHLTRGYITSRQQVQYVVVESRRTGAHLEFDQQPGGGTQVTNRLGVPLILLVVRDQGGELRVARDLAAGATAALEPADAPSVAREWTRLSAAGEPAFPPDFEPRHIEDMSDLFGTDFSYYDPDDAQLAPPIMKRSLPERRLRQRSAAEFAHLRAGQYAAVTGEPLEVALGYPAARRQASVYFLLGAW